MSQSRRLERHLTWALLDGKKPKNAVSDAEYAYLQLSTSEAAITRKAVACTRKESLIFCEKVAL